jgi:drug/metabolite transporter (DMT)-like permease
MRERYTAYGALILAEIIWGSFLVIVKPSLEFVSPQQFLFLRYLIALPFILPMIIITFKSIIFLKRKPLPCSSMKS